MVTSLASQKQTRKWWPVKFSASKLLSTTPVYLKYKTITLEIFLEIATTSNYKLLLISGEATVDECNEQWEKIVELNNYHCGDMEYYKFKSLLATYRDLVQKFNAVRSALLYLTGAIDDARIDYLNAQGYKLDKNASNTVFWEQWQRAFNKSNNLNSKQLMALNQLKMFNEAQIMKRKAFNEEQDSNGFSERLTALNFHLGFCVERTITLENYNDYVKLIHKNNGSRTERHNNG